MEHVAQEERQIGSPAYFEIPWLPHKVWWPACINCLALVLFLWGKMGKPWPRVWGQAASTKAGSLPAPWVEELRDLQDELPISNFQDISTFFLSPECTLHFVSFVPDTGLGKWRCYVIFGGRVAISHRIINMVCGCFKPLACSDLGISWDQEVLRTIKADLGRPLDETFRDFGQRPIASASVGQDGCSTVTWKTVGWRHTYMMWLSLVLMLVITAYFVLFCCILLLYPSNNPAEVVSSFVSSAGSHGLASQHWPEGLLQKKEGKSILFQLDVQ